jgi:hypothetical protein
MKSDETLSNPPAPGSSRAKCGQCGKELRHVPFLLKNIMCRECYGMERYRRTGGMIAPDRTAGAADEAVTA